MPEYIDLALTLDIRSDMHGQVAVSVPPTPPPPGYEGNVLTATPSMVALPFSLDRFGRPV